jgi:hypothetical protein
MQNTHLGVMGSNPITGECIAVFLNGPPPGEQSVLIASGVMFQRKPLGFMKEAFCEVHPSRRVSAQGSSIGRYKDADIPEWIETSDGLRHEYCGTLGQSIDFTRLSEHQMAMSSGLIYETTK